MENNQFIARENRFSRRQFSQFQQLSERSTHRLDNNHRFSEPKARVNLIKINKNKLPTDFFQKKDNQSRRNIVHKLHFHQEPTQAYNIPKKAESERLHYSPQKTSFFGFFEEEEKQISYKNTINTKLYSRKFQTRDQAKRQAFPVESARKLNTASKNAKNELLELFPPTLDEQMTDIINSSSKSQNLKLSPRKQFISRHRDPSNLLDPQKHTFQRNERNDKQLHEVRKQRVVKSNNVSMSQPVKEYQNMNITFFNAKSTCFPPISRPNIP